MPNLTVIAPDSDEEKILDVIKKCKASPEHFIDNYCMIDDEKEGIIPFALWPGQKKLVKLFTQEQFVIALKSRQIGISWLAAAWSVWLCAFFTQKNIIVISYNEDVANAFVAKCQFIYDNLPLFLKPAVHKRNDSLLHFARYVYDGNIRVLRGRNSKIHAFPRTERTGRFVRASAVIFDEAAHIPDMDPLLVAALGSLATSGGKCFMISTANGMGNSFYRIWSEHGVKGKQYQDFVGWFGGWQTNPDRDEAWYEKQKRIFGDAVKQEFPATPDEAFIATGACYFDAELVAERAKLLAQNPPTADRGDILFDPTIQEFAKPQFVPSSTGEIVIWQHPERGKRYCIGCDVAEGLEKGDKTVFYVMREDTGEFVAEYCSKIAPDQLAFKVRSTAVYYNGAFVGVEANNQGLTTLKYLTDEDMAGYSNIYFREIQDELLPGTTRKLGWFTSSLTRRNMLAVFSSWFREEKVKIYSIDLLIEMQRFVRDSQGHPSARGYDLDDKVMAAAITVQMHLAQAKLEDLMGEETSLEFRRKAAIEQMRQKMAEGEAHYIFATDEEADEDLEAFVI
jgi:hypothetical protein